MAFGATLALSSCCAIDEDLSVCLAEYEAEYELHLITNEEPEIKRVLGDRTDIADALRQHLSDLFSDYGRDLDLMFYGVEPGSPADHHEQHTMNASTYPCHVSLDVGNYDHVAVANGAGYEVNVTSDVVDSRHQALFSGRKHLDCPVYGRYSFHMNLYTANSGAAIVLDPRTASFTDVKVLTTGFASSFEVRDSTYHFDRDYSVRSEQVNLSDTTSWLCYCATSYPSREPAVIPEGDNGYDPIDFVITRSRIDVDEPYFIYKDCGENLWSYDCYVTMADGTITRTVLSIRHPLRAGQLKIIRGYIDDQGVIRIYDQEVGTGVDLNWKPGNEYPDIPLGVKQY